MKQWKVCVSLLMAAGSVLGQDAVESAVFDVATVKRSQAGIGTNPRMNEATATLTYTNVTLKWVITRAYQAHEISGPDWLDERYDIIAKYSPNVSARQRGTMLQALLVERFKLVVHRETKERAGYRLVVEKGGPRLRQTEGSPTGFQVSSEGSGRRLRSRIPVRALASFLSDQLRAPVVDQSGLQGTFDVDLDWTPDDRPGDGIAAGPSIFTALREQLGLKLESAKLPREILVIDHAEKVPVEN